MRLKSERANQERDGLSASKKGEFSTSSREKRRRRGTISLSASQGWPHGGEEPRYLKKTTNSFLSRVTFIYINSPNQPWPTQLLTRPLPQRLQPRWVSFKALKNNSFDCVKMLWEVLKSPLFFVRRTGFCDSICFPPFCGRCVTVSAT